MRILILIIAIIIFSATAVQLYKLQLKKAELGAELQKVDKKVESLAKENQSLEDEIKYYSNQDNLAKEAKAQLNYAVPGEKLIVVVPKKQ